MSLADFDINADGGDQGFDGTNAQVLTIRLRNASVGVRTWQLQTFDAGAFSNIEPIERNPPRQSPGAPELSLVGATTGKLVSPATVGGSITTTLPGSGSHSWILRSIVNGGTGADGKADSSLIRERMVVIRDGDDNRKIVATERTQYHDDGWAEAFVAGTVGSVGPAGATGPAGTNGTNGSNGATGATGAAGSNGATGATGPAGPSTTLHTVTLSAGLHSDYALPVGFVSGDVLMVQLLGDAIIDGIAAPATNNFIARIVFWDSSAGLWKVSFRDADNSVSSAANQIRTPHEGANEGPDHILGPSDEESATLVYANTGSASTWRFLASSWQAKIRKFDGEITAAGRWNFEAVQTDESGNGFTLSGATAFREIWPGVLGVTAGNPVRGVSDAALRITGDLTINAICVMRVVPANANVVFFIGTVANTQIHNIQYQIFLVDQDNATTRSESGAAGTNADFTTSGADRGFPALGSIFMLTFRRSAGVRTIWINGKQFGAASAGLTAPDGGTSSVLNIRGSATSPEVGAVEIIASALTDAQIRARYNNTLGPICGFI